MQSWSLGFYMLHDVMYYIMDGELNKFKLNAKANMLQRMLQTAITTL